MNSRALLSLVLVAFLCGIGIFFLRDFPQAQNPLGVSIGPDSKSDAPQKAAPRLSESQNDSGPHSPTGTRTKQMPDLSLAAPPAQLESGATACKLVCIDVDGAPFTPAIATVTFRLDGVDTQAEFTDGWYQGKFERTSGTTDVQVIDIEVPGQLARLSPFFQIIKAGTDATQEITARLVPSIILHVVDADTRQELRDVKIARDASILVDDLAAPGLERKVNIWRASSPFEFQALKLNRHNPDGLMRIGAPGYAWERFRIDPTAAAEHTIALTRGASLEVEVLLPGTRDGIDEVTWDNLRRLGQRVDLNPFVLRIERLAEPDFGLASSRFDMPAGLSYSKFEGLLPGPYLVQLQHMVVSTKAQTYGSVEVRLAPGEQASIALNVQAVQPVATAPVRITLRTPGAWPSERAPKLELQAPEDENFHVSIPLDAKPAGLGQWLYEIEDVPIGSYVLRLEQPDYSELVEVTLDGLDHTLELPHALPLNVRIIDPQTDELADITSLLWLSPATDANPNPLTGKARTKVPGEFHFVAPTGLLHLHALQSGGVLNPGSVPHDAADQSYRLELVRSVAFELTLEQGGKPLSGSMQEQVVPLLSIEGPGRLASMSYSGPVLRLQMTAPGIYTVGLKESDRFAVPTPHQIDVTQDGKAKLALPIELKK